LSRRYCRKCAALPLAGAALALALPPAPTLALALALPPAPTLALALAPRARADTGPLRDGPADAAATAPAAVALIARIIGGGGGGGGGDALSSRPEARAYGYAAGTDRRGRAAATPSVRRPDCSDAGGAGSAERGARAD
jgi:hypothetical protein